MRRLDSKLTTGIAVAGFLVLVVLGGCSASGESAVGGHSSSPSPSPTPTPAPTPTLVPSGPPTANLADVASLELELPGGPDRPTGLDGSIWILAPDGPLMQPPTDAFVYRIDPATGEEQARVPIGGRLCQGIAAGFGSLWACSDAGLERIDPAANVVVATVAFGTARVSVRPAMSEDRVWMLGGNVYADQVVEIDPETNAVVATHELGYAGAGLAYAAGAVWVTAPADGLLLRLDPSTGEVAVHASDLPWPGSIVFAAGSLWVSLYSSYDGDPAAPGDPVIARLSVDDGSVQARVDVGTNSMVDTDLAADADAVWVRTTADPFVVRIDPSTNEATWAVGGFHSGGSIASIDGAVWTTSIEFQTVWRIDPPK